MEAFSTFRHSEKFLQTSTWVGQQFILLLSLLFPSLSTSGLYPVGKSGDDCREVKDR